MIYEGCELVATHLRDGEMGVNAIRNTVPLGVNDPLIEPVTVKHEFEIAYLAGGDIPQSAYEEGPLVLVRRADDVGEFSAPGNPELLSDDERLGFAILVLFARRETRTLHLENRCLSALLRVVRRSLGMLFEDVSHDARALRGVQFVGTLAPPRVVPTIAQFGKVDLLAGAVLLDVRVTDRWASGIVE